MNPQERAGLEMALHAYENTLALLKSNMPKEAIAFMCLSNIHSLEEALGVHTAETDPSLRTPPRGKLKAVPNE